MSTPTPPPLLQMTDIVKEFPGVRALDRVCLDLRRGEVHALVGENGAGKSTLMNVLGGVLQPDSGSIQIEGKQVRMTTPQRAEQLGVAFIHQELNLIDVLAVKENFFIGRELCNRWRRIDWREIERRVKALLGRLNLKIDPNALVESLSVAERQMVEIAKALAFEAKIIVMDEPTSSLTQAESQKLFSLIQRLRSEDKGIIYISHRMEEIFDVADRVTVMRNGQYVATKPIGETGRDDVVRMMVGQDVASRFWKETAVTDDIILSVEGLSGSELMEDISFELHAGEVLGIAGLLGSGRTELLETLFGIRPARSGKIVLNGTPVESHSARDAIRAGLAYVPEDRQLKGLFLNFDIKRNIHITPLEKGNHGGFVEERVAASQAVEYVEKLGVVTSSIDQTIRNLSGGNQQKVVLARWMAAGMDVLLINEPTRGIDVGAKAEIYKVLSELNKRGIGVIMVSSDLPEVLEISDRILVMHEGRLTGEFKRTDGITQEDLMQAMTGRVIGRHHS